MIKEIINLSGDPFNGTDLHGHGTFIASLLSSREYGIIPSELIELHIYKIFS